MRLRHDTDQIIYDSSFAPGESEPSAEYIALEDIKAWEYGWVQINK